MLLHYDVVLIAISLHVEVPLARACASGTRRAISFLKVTEDPSRQDDFSRRGRCVNSRNDKDILSEECDLLKGRPHLG